MLSKMSNYPTCLCRSGFFRVDRVSFFTLYKSFDSHCLFYRMDLMGSNNDEKLSLSFFLVWCWWWCFIWLESSLFMCVYISSSFVWFVCVVWCCQVLVPFRFFSSLSLFRLPVLPLTLVCPWHSVTLCNGNVLKIFSGHTEIIFVHSRIYRYLLYCMAL